MSSLQSGDSIVVYENKDEDYKIVVDVIECDYLNMAKDTGNSGWSGGNIPKGTRTLYPHIEGSSISGIKEVGFYETVTRTDTVKIVDAYNANISNTVIYNINDVN